MCVPIQKDKSFNHRRKLARAAVAAAAAMFASQAYAATTFVWQPLTAGNASGDWDVPANWNPTGPADGTDNTADFSTADITATSTVLLNGNRLIGNMKFGDTVTSTGASWILSPGTPSTSTLTLQTTAGGPAPTITLSLPTNRSVTIIPQILGNQGLIRTGSGNLILGNGAADTIANTFTGNTVVSGAGAGLTHLQLNKAVGVNAIGGNLVLLGSGQTILSRSNQMPDSATLYMAAGEFLGNGASETLSSMYLAGNTNNGFQSGAGTITATNSITVAGGQLTVNSGGGTVVTNQFTMLGGSTLFGTSSGIQTLNIGAGGLTIGNSSTITLNSGSSGVGGRILLSGNVTSLPTGSGSNQILSNLSTTGGVIDLNNAVRTFTVYDGSSNVDLNITSVIGAIGAGGTYATSSAGITKLGSGIMQLAATKAHTYTGATTVNEGMLVVNYSVAGPTSNVIDSSSALVLGGGTLSFSGRSGTTVNQTFGGGSLTLNPGGSSIRFNASGTGNTVVVTLPNTWNRAAGATLMIDNAVSTNVAGIVVSSPLTPSATQSPTQTILGYGFVKDVAGTGFAAVADVGGVGNVVRYTAATSIDINTATPTVNLNPGENYRFNVGTSAATLGSGSTLSAQSLQISPTVATTINFGGKTVSLSSGGLLVGGNQTLTMVNGQFGDSGSELILFKTGTTNVTIGGGGTTTLTGGTGRVTLSGDNAGGLMVFGTTTSTYSGGFRLNAGVNVVPTVSTPGSAGSPSSGPFGTGTLTFAGGGMRATTGNSVTVHNAVEIAADVPFITGTSTNLIFTGPTTLSGGVHSIFQNATGSVILSGQIGDAGANLGFNKQGSATLVLSNNTNNYGGVTTVFNGSLELQAANALGATTAGTVINGASSVLRLSPSVGTTFAAEPLTFTSNGTLRSVTSANIWTGPVNFVGNGTINSASLPGSSLDISGNVDLGANPVAINTLTITGDNGGQVAGSAIGPITISGSISGLGNIVRTVLNGTPGAVTLSGNNTYTGNTTVNAGPLYVSGTHGAGFNLAGDYSIASTGTMTATLGGAGGVINLAPAKTVSLVGTTNAASILSPGGPSAGPSGSTIDILTVNNGNGVAFGDNSTFAVDTGAGSSSDLLKVLGGTLNISAVGTTLAVTASDAGTYTIAEHDLRVGTFQTVTLNGVTEITGGGTVGPDMTVTYNPGSIVLTITNAVPEPGMLGLIGVFAATCLGRRRRRVP